MSNVGEIRRQLDDAMARNVTSADLYLVRDARHLASKLDGGYAAIIRDRADLLASKLENVLDLIA